MTAWSRDLHAVRGADVVVTMLRLKSIVPCYLTHYHVPLNSTASFLTPTTDLASY